MRLFRAAAIVFVVAAVLAGVVIVAATRVVAQERTPQWLFDHGHIGEARAVTQKRIAANPRDAYALVKKGSASGELMRVEFVDKYSSPALIPPALRPRYAMLAAANEKAFRDAEALGWAELAK